jgi:Na+-transporting NADH:ubiquinone oxidoreductase subunit A
VRTRQGLAQAGRKEEDEPLMAVHKISKGLDLPISGRPVQVIRETIRSTRVAVLADDFPGMKPRMHIEEGQSVKRGQLLFENRKIEGVRHTAPGAGRVIAIHRGARRALQSVVIDLSDDERNGTPGDDAFEAFQTYSGGDAAGLERQQVVDLLVESGLWTALRTRPFSKTPAIDGSPAALFVTAIDTNPLAPIPEVVLDDRIEDFELGLKVLARLCADGPTYLCVSEHSDLPSKIDAPVKVERFAGPHPSGTVGLHIHTLRPASRHVQVWHVGYQDVASIGRLFSTGRLDVSRVVSLAGPSVEDPRLVRTRVGAATDEVFTAPADAPELRVIAGSVLSGKKAMGDVFGYLGRFDNQISVIPEDREKTFLGWLSPGPKRFSIKPIYISKLFPSRLFDFGTSTNGSPRAMVPIGMYEQVMPLDILPTYLLRSLIIGDIEKAEALGALELDEEDVALCTFVCPGKYEYGPILRQNLDMIEKAG